jgi:hypothetical protein
MSNHKEADPEGDAADEARHDPLSPTCASCGGPLDEDGDCPDPLCPQSPYHLDEDDDIIYPEGELGEADE